MKSIGATAILLCCPALAAAQEASTVWSDLGSTRSLRLFQEQPDQPSPDRFHAALNVLFTGSFHTDTLVTASGSKYSEILDIGTGLRFQADFLARLHDKTIANEVNSGFYAALEWNWFHGNPNVNMHNGQTFSFNTMNTVSVILGPKLSALMEDVVELEARLGGGFVHFSQLSYTDVTGVPIPGRQYFKPLTRGVFEIGGRVSPLHTPNFLLDFGAALRAAGGMAPGLHFNSPGYDPRFFVTYILEIGLTIRL